MKYCTNNVFNSFPVFNISINITSNENILNYPKNDFP